MVVYKIVYTRQAAKDINNLKAAGLGEKAKELLEIIRVVRCFQRCQIGYRIDSTLI